MSETLAVESGIGRVSSFATPRRLRRAVAVVVAVAVLWALRTPGLRILGSALVAEGPLASADVVVVSNASPVADAFEAATLYRTGYAQAIVIPRFTREHRVDDLHRLGIPYLPQTELMEAVLERSGVPSAAIRTLPARVDGTESEVAAVAAFVTQQQPRSVLFVTARSHTARSAWLLRRTLPRGTEIIVRSPSDDLFDPGSWWQSRGQTRELLVEYLRWGNTLLGDLWG
jgi:uncharacterized SAM-binding protein YcdF (DUF218 family)